MAGIFRFNKKSPGDSTDQVRLVLLAAFPKSASQHMLYRIESGFRDTHTIRAKIDLGYGHNFLSKTTLLEHIDPGKINILYGHYPLNHANRDVLDTFAGKQAIVLIRSLPDVVVSYADHMRKNSWGPLDWGVEGCIECHPGFADITTAGQHDFIIRFILPWYLRFLSSWLAYRDTLPVKIVTFEDQTLHAGDTLSEIGEYLQLETVPDRELAADGGVVKVNFNQGISGRGRELLSAAQLEEIARLTDTAGLQRYASLCRYLTHGPQAMAPDTGL